MNGNWIKIHRQILEWEWYKDSNTKSLFIHLLLKANWKDGRFQGKNVLRGQVVTGRKALSCDTGMSEQSIRTCLARLKESGEITIKATKAFSVITICNYGNYQVEKDGANQPANQQLTNDQPTSNQQVTTIEEGKEGKKKKIYREDITTFVKAFYEHVKKETPQQMPRGEDITGKACDVIDKLIEKDKFSFSEIKEVIRWGKTDDFWKAQLYSLASLRVKKSGDDRTKFQKMSAAMGGNKKGDSDGWY